MLTVLLCRVPSAAVERGSDGEVSLQEFMAFVQVELGWGAGGAWVGRGWGAGGAVPCRHEPTASTEPNAGPLAR